MFHTNNDAFIDFISKIYNRKINVLDIDSGTESESGSTSYQGLFYREFVRDYGLCMANGNLNKITIDTSGTGAEYNSDFKYNYDAGNSTTATMNAAGTNNLGTGKSFVVYNSLLNDNSDSYRNEATTFVAVYSVSDEQFVNYVLVKDENNSKFYIVIDDSSTEHTTNGFNSEYTFNDDSKIRVLDLFICSNQTYNSHNNLKFIVYYFTQSVPMGNPTENYMVLKYVNIKEAKDGKNSSNKYQIFDNDDNKLTIPKNFLSTFFNKMFTTTIPDGITLDNGARVLVEKNAILDFNIAVLDETLKPMNIKCSKQGNTITISLKDTNGKTLDQNIKFDYLDLFADQLDTAKNTSGETSYTYYENSDKKCVCTNNTVYADRFITGKELSYIIELDLSTIGNDEPSITTNQQDKLYYYVLASFSYSYESGKPEYYTGPTDE